MSLENQNQINIEDNSEIWEKRLRWIMPLMAISSALLIWEFLVWYYEIPHYLIPAPSRISKTLWVDGPSLLNSMLFTIKLTIFSLLLAI